MIVYYIFHGNKMTFQTMHGREERGKAQKDIKTYNVEYVRKLIDVLSDKIN